MRIIKSSRGFSVSADHTVRVTFGHEAEGQPAAAIYEAGDRYPILLVSPNPRNLWRAAYNAANHLARYTE